MIIQERIYGTIAGYDYQAKSWTKNAVSLSDNNVISAKIDRQCCKDGAPEIGGVYAASLRMTVKLPPAWSGYNLRGCKVTLRHNLNNAAEDAPLGVFWITYATKKGGRNSPVFDIEGLDAVGWLDISSYNLNLSARNYKKKITMGAWLALTHGDTRMIDYISRGGYYSDGWLPALTGLTNQIITDVNGVENMLTWENWDFSKNGEYINAYLWSNANEARETPDYRPLYFTLGNYAQDDAVHLQNGCDKFDSDIPRELFSQFSAVAGGFVFARENGNLSLGQFMMREYPAIDIRGITEAETFDYANYVIKIGAVTFGVESSKDDFGWAESTGYSGARDYAGDIDEYIYLNWNIDANVAANAIYFRRVQPPDDWNDIWYSSTIWSAFYGGYHDRGYTKNTPEWDAAWHASPTFRPFKAHIFPQNYAQIPHLGGAVLLDEIQSDGSTHEIWSTVTHIQWALHGGYTIQCAGEDCRAMVDSVTRSGASRAESKLSTWIRAIGG